MKRHMRAVSFVLAGLTGPAMLAGCQNWENDQRLLTYGAWRPIGEWPAPRVEQVPVRHVVHFLPGADIMTAADRVALAGFLANNGIERGATVALAVVNPDPAAGGMRASNRLQAVSSALNQMGVATVVQPATTDAGGSVVLGQADDVAVVAYSLAALPQECPGYTTPIVLDNAQRPIPVMGCSNAANLGMMASKPGDLVQGRTRAPADGEGAVLAIQRYRAGAITPLVKEGTSE
jgi:pilus biogenesis lipoprotein CpaD